MIIEQAPSRPVRLRAQFSQGGVSMLGFSRSKTPLCLFTIRCLGHDGRQPNRASGVGTAVRFRWKHKIFDQSGTVESVR